MPKCPYSWPHRSRKAMLAYLGEHESYHPMNSWNGGFVLAWNVKVYRVDEMGKAAPEDFPVQTRFDRAWRELAGSDAGLFWEACEAASSYYLDGMWTNYPGIEQGEWQFGRNGRSGGYFVLTECPAWVPAPRAWRQFSMIWHDSAHYREWLADLDTSTLRRFYRAIRVLDYDLRREACEAEVSYHIAARRYDWEQERVAGEESDAREMESGRPDLYC